MRTRWRRPCLGRLRPADVFFRVGRDISELQCLGVFNFRNPAESLLDRLFELVSVRLDKREAILPLAGHVNDDRCRYQHRPRASRPGATLAHRLTSKAKSGLHRRVYTDNSTQVRFDVQTSIDPFGIFTF